MLVHFPLLVVECGVLHFFSSGWRRPPGGGGEYRGGVWPDTSVIFRPAPVPDRGGCTVAGSTSASVGCQSGPVRFQLAEQSTGGDLLVVAMIWWSLDVFTCSGSRSGWSHRRRFLIDFGGASCSRSVTRSRFVLADIVPVACYPLYKYSMPLTISLASGFQHVRLSVWPFGFSMSELPR